MTAILIVSSLSVNSQWSGDPANPGVVCNQAGLQNNVRTIADNNGGVYVYWLDARLNPGSPAREIYGQYFDANGYPAWESGGRLIASHNSQITFYTVGAYENGDVLIGWQTKSPAAPAADTLLFQKLGGNGEFLWEENLVVASAAEPAPNNILYLNNFGLIPVNGEYAVILRVGYGFGFDGNRYTYFNGDGELTGTVNGWPAGPQSYYGGSSIMPTYDESGDILLYYSTGNGSGASLMCVRAGDGGVVSWGPVNVTEGTGGLEYSFSAISDEHGATFLWQGNGDGTPVNLYSRRLGFDGTFKWEGNTAKICIAEGGQTNFTWRRVGDMYYIFWADGRPGTDPGYYDIYGQKFDTTGNIYWTQNGIEIASFNTYSPYPRLAIDAEGNLVVSHQSNVSGLMAQKVTPAGTLPWGADARQVATVAFVPSAGDHQLVVSEDNTIAVWAAGNGSSDDIYIMRVDEVLHASVVIPGEEKIIIYPNPAADMINISLPGLYGVKEVSLADINGRIVEKMSFSHQGKAADLIQISTASLPAGTYFLRVNTHDQTLKHLVIVR